MIPVQVRYLGGNAVADLRIRAGLGHRYAPRPPRPALPGTSLDEQDARVFRCPGCGEWRYRAHRTRGRGCGRCPACGRS